MIYQIDQSGKIEQTNKMTVIAFSDSTKYAVVYPAKIKHKIQEVFRMHGFTALFIYYSFSVGVYYLLEHLEQKSYITIDLEYPGKDKIIKQFVDSLLKKNNKPDHDINFARIGNRPLAHYAAKDVFDKKIKANKILSVKDIIKAIKKTDGCLRECLSTLVNIQSRSYKAKISQRGKKVKKIK